MNALADAISILTTYRTRKAVLRAQAQRRPIGDWLDEAANQVESFSGFLRGSLWLG